jgi:hypothetical protein
MITNSDLSEAVVTGFFSLPSAALAEANPSAYNNAMAGAPEGAGSCAHCGNGIRHHVVVRLTDGRTAFIGQDCAIKIGQDIARSVRERITTEELLKREDAAARKHAAWLAEKAAAEAKAKAQTEANAWLIAELETAYPGNFVKSILAELRSGYDPLTYSPRCKDILIDMIASQAGRRNSKAYTAKGNQIAAKLFPEETSTQQSS